LSIPEPGYGPVVRRALVLALALVAICSTLAGCGSSGSATRRLEQVDAERADIVLNRSDPRGERVVHAVRAAAARLRLAGVVFGVWDGDRELVRGAIDLQPGTEPTSKDAAFRVGQPMESMATTVLLQLAAEGKIGLDEPVARYLPDLPRGNRITPRMLANSTAGIADYITDPRFAKALYSDPFRKWTYEALMKYANDRVPVFAPGTSWAYSHTDLLVLAEVLERATGKSMAQLLQKRIFDPLHLDHTAVAETTAIAAPTFHAYTAERGHYEDSTYWNPTWALGSGNLNSTVEDLGRWGRALGSGELLSVKAHEEQVSSANAGLGPLTKQRYFTYGIGAQGSWLIGNPQLQGYRGLIAQRRDSPLTIVVYTTDGHRHTKNQNDAIVIGNRLAEILSPRRPLGLKP
jgi:D-alanyl-D-alanine carboxypeptidase